MPVNINGTTGIDTPGVASTAMPTSNGDPVVESGSNTDGDWTRFADGTQICTHRFTGAPQVTSGGSLLLSGDITWTLPIAFINTTYTWTGSARRASNGAGTTWLSRVDLLQTETTVYTIRVTGGQDFVDAQVFMQAIGRWK